MKYYIGIDLGGTIIKAGVVNEKFEIIAKASTKTLCPRPAKDICDDMAKVSIEACKLAGISVDDVEWIGVGTPGIADNINGTIPYSNNLDFHDVPVRKYIQAHINKPVYVATMPMQLHTANLLQVLQRAQRTLSASLWEQALAQESSLTARSSQAPTLQAQSLAIWSSRSMALSVPVEERAASRYSPPQQVLSA